MADRIKYDDHGELDEVVVTKPTAFHLEYMADNQVWMRIDRHGDDALVVVLTGHGKIEGTVRED